MRRIRQYLEKQKKSSSFFSQSPNVDTKIIVVIPAYKEDNISETIMSLFDCDIMDGSIEVIVFVNGSSSDSPEIKAINEVSFIELYRLKSKIETGRKKLLIFKDLNINPKFAGVGIARKMLMDEAAFRFSQIENKDGIIVNLDADCLVEKNYLQAIQEFFNLFEKNACCIHYEHRILNIWHQLAIVYYELHLRYFIGMQKLFNLPFAFHTIGSAMGVDVDGYCSVGGMNTKKAGEDFYFLHKFIKNNNCGNIYNTTVYPSDRISDRVPFGTGKAIGSLIDGKAQVTYNPKSFVALEKLISKVDFIYEYSIDGLYSILDDELLLFLSSIRFNEKINEIKRNTKNFDAFKKRFFQYFDSFQLMKYLHFMRDNKYEDVSINEALIYYFDKINVEINSDLKENLLILRKFDKLDY